uniref:protein-tyrosine-phosphatase n=1 Tax=Sinocyclocheilus grahami TaxID=75366 RepID=A0A672QR74_SINGR
MCGSPFDDYINANYVPGYNSRKEFIAAQGPLPTTVNEFWRMVWEKNVHTIVMLTKCNEMGRELGTLGRYSVCFHCRNQDLNKVPDKNLPLRKSLLFHFTVWPDHGVPQTTEVLIDFRHLVKEHMNQYSHHSPTVVHCSAGVGRMGTFIRSLITGHQNGLSDARQHTGGDSFGHIQLREGSDSSTADVHGCKF